jgi:hypothetical protein
MLLEEDKGDDPVGLTLGFNLGTERSDVDELK